jgi:bromodomain-containing protein 7
MAIVEDPFSVLCALVPDAPTRPYLTSLYPPSTWSPSNSSRFQSEPPSERGLSVSQTPQPFVQTSAATTLSLHTRPPLATVTVDNIPSSSSSSSTPVSKPARKHWSIARNISSRSRNKEEEESLSDPFPWQQTREAHAVDYGSFAVLAAELAEEMARRKRNSAHIEAIDIDNDNEDEKVLDALRESLDVTSSPNVNMDSGRYWSSQRASDGEDYVRDLVYGGPDGIAYARSLSEFVAEETELTQVW